MNLARLLSPVFVGLTLACGRTTTDDGAAGDDPDVLKPDPCAAFGTEECEGHDGCSLFTGQRIDWVAYCVERGTPRALGCISKSCRREERIGKSKDGSEWLIPSGCMPSGWEEIALAPPPLCTVPLAPAHEYCLFYLSEDAEGITREGGTVSESEARAICASCAESVVQCAQISRCWGGHCILDGGCHCSEGAYCIAETLMEVSPERYPYPWGSLCPIRGEGGAPSDG